MRAVFALRRYRRGNHLHIDVIIYGEADSMAVNRGNNGCSDANVELFNIGKYVLTWRY